MADPAWSEAGLWIFAAAMLVLLLWVALPDFIRTWRRVRRARKPHPVVTEYGLPTSERIAALKRWEWHDEDWRWWLEWS